MLVARHETGRLVNVLEHPAPQGQFTCPACCGPVRYKSGKILRSHFAHVSLRDCHYFPENESSQHLSLKSQLYNWLATEEEVQLEAHIPELNQIADLLVNGKLALEVQCSSLPIVRLQERTQAYQQAGYQVLWLLGKELWLRNRLSALQKQFLYFSLNMGFYLWELDEERSEIRLRYLIHEDVKGRVHCLTKTFPFGQGNLLAILRLPFARQAVSSLRVESDQTIARFVAQQLYYRVPKWLERQARAYEQGENLLTKSATDWYPQIRLPSSAIGFAQIKRDLSKIYQDFDAYYAQQEDKSFQWLYPPKKYVNSSL